MKRQKVTSDSVQSTPNEERKFRDLDDDKEDGIGMFDYICSLATHGFYYMKQKKILQFTIFGMYFWRFNLAVKGSDSWCGCSEQPEKIWIKAIDAQKKKYCNHTIKYHQFSAKLFEKS